MSFELSGKSRSILSVADTDRDLMWTFYVIERDGRRFLVPRSPRGSEGNNPEFMGLQSEATAFADAEARRLHWID